MKRFAVILIIAVLALGCVFAASTGDDSTNKVAGTTSGNKIYVVTTIGRVYPVYQIVAYTGDSEDASGSVTSAATEYSDTASNKIVGAKTTENGKEIVSVKIAIQHYGLENNDASSSKIVDIRYNGTVEVTVEATALQNVSTGYATQAKAEAGKHAWETAVSSVTAFTEVDSKYCDVTAGTAKTASAAVTAVYGNGTVEINGAAQTIANGCVFKWDTTNLTAGDTYKADVVVTYTNV